MLRPCFPPAHGRFCEAVDAPSPHPCRSPPAGREVGRLDARRVGSLRAVRALGLGGPGASRSLLTGRFTHSYVRWALGGRSLVASAPLSLVSLGKGGPPQFTEGHLCTSPPLAEGPLGPWVAADGEDGVETEIVGEGTWKRGRHGDPGVCFLL